MFWTHQCISASLMHFGIYHIVGSTCSITALIIALHYDAPQRPFYTVAAIFMHETTYSSTFRLKQVALFHRRKECGACRLVHHDMQ